MSCQLVLTDARIEGTRIVIGIISFIASLQFSYNVSLLYYYIAPPNKESETRFHSIGNITGKNRFVNLTKLDNLKYDKIKKRFEIVNVPVIKTDIEGLASNKEDNYSLPTYVITEDLLNSVIITESLQRLFELSIVGERSNILKQAEFDMPDAIRENLSAIDISRFILEQV